MKSYLVTGGCGFVGVNLIQQLISRSSCVRVLDNLSVGKSEDLASLGVSLEIGDIRDPVVVAKAFKGIDVVVHLAAHTRVIESTSNPELNFDINAAGTLNVLRGCMNAGVQTMLFASTGGAILGEQQPPVHEEMVPRPLSPYGASKLAGEAYCSAFYGSFGLKTTTLRFSNIYGPYSYRKGSVIAQYLKNVLDEDTLVVYGDGLQTRDFLYVGDVVQAILLADEAEVPGEVFQIASGRETSIQGLVEKIRQLVPEADINVRYENARPGEILHNYATYAKAQRMLGYNPTVNLDDGLKNTWEWFKLYRDRFTSI